MKLKVKLASNLIDELNQHAIDDEIDVLVAGGIIEQNGKILLLQRCDSETFLPGIVEIPSGKLDPGETIYEGAKREIQEETGLDVESIDEYLGHFDYVTKRGKKARQFNFIVHTNHYNVVLNLNEHMKYFWEYPDSDEYNKMNISDETRKIISTYKQNSRL